MARWSGADSRMRRPRGCPTSPSSRATTRSTGCGSPISTRGRGRPVVFFHGEPTWSFLWRKVIPPVRDAGYRCIAPDYAGFGRSDKPTDIGWYSYDRHVELMAALLEELDLRDATAVVHDWGGPIGLRLAVEHPDRFSRMVIIGHRPLHRPPEDERRLVQIPRVRPRRNEDVPVGFLVKAGCEREPGRRGDRRLRGALSRRPSRRRGPRLPGADPRPSPMPRARPRAGAWPTRCARTSGRRSCSGPTPTRRCRSRSASRSPSGSATRAPRVIENARHFLHEDAGEEIGAIVAEWLGEAS